MADDGDMMEPPSDYFKHRRRSNTLPSDIIRNLKDRKSKKKSPEPSQTSSSKGTSSSANQSPSIQRKLTESKSIHIKKQTPRHKAVDQLRQSALSSSVPKDFTAHSYIRNLIRTSSAEAIERGPLPRGSNLYESLMSEFGHDEEERDTLSPLPSPQLIRKGLKTTHEHRAVDAMMPFDLSPDSSASNSPSLTRKHVRWNEVNSTPKKTTTKPALKKKISV